MKSMIVLHCTASDRNSLDSMTFEEFMESIINSWKNDNHWKTGGYHVIIWIDGSIAVWKNGLKYEIGVDLLDANFDGITNGAAGYNSQAIHVCYAGGVEDGKNIDTRTVEQKDRMQEIVTRMKDRFSIKDVYGHRDLYQYDARNKQFLNKKVAKDCPCFNVALWLKDVCLS